MKNCLNKEIDFLGIDDDITEILKQNKIYKVEDLWKLKKTDLKHFNLSDKEIYYIEIKLQLNGLDLNKKVYR